ncbi:Putative transposase of IS4/5 family [Quadrisphaera granulorum]|uniref:Putative transposase of IS4/5 family DUF4096 n=1 Tax=Quadrisphaera granulorum TaxID=317664 RepID=A0A316ACG4_9ACTN|nr:IS5 family transposase [Quadrisphaera granulorum]PWJ54958.1 putative transposase of IS4/5 family DUF4096 [Quadrisphaera granulorum]SZE95904.1 Putative transposase of IS4/5 family [Quadrisphaera granulorum]
MPALPACILNPLRTQFLDLLHTALPPVPDTHPLGCHRPRIPDDVVFDHLISALVLGVGYEKIATDACSATTMRRRRDEWARAGIMAQLHTSVLTAYERLIGLELGHVCIDGCITKAPCGGQCAGRSPVDRGKGGMKRSQVTDGTGVPLAAVPAPANVPDHKLLAASLDNLKDLAPLGGDVTVHLDAGYDYAPCRQELDARGLAASISKRGTPIQVGRRWVVEAANSWMNDFAKLRRCTERTELAVQAYLDLAMAIVTLRALWRRAHKQYRWEGRPRSARLR